MIYRFTKYTIKTQGDSMMKTNARWDDEEKVANPSNKKRHCSANCKLKISLSYIYIYRCEIFPASF